MNLANNVEKMNKLTLFVIDRYKRDENFKALIQSKNYNNSDLENVLGFKLNQNEIKFRIEDQTDIDTIYLNIPRVVDIDSIELSDGDLNAVSGGFTTTFCVVLTVASIVDACNDMYQGFKDVYEE